VDLASCYRWNALLISTETTKGTKPRARFCVISCVSWLALLLLFFGFPLGARQDPYDLLLTGGHVIDPANEIDGVRDVAIRSGRIARVAASIPAQSARRTVDLRGLYVVPGLVDIHSHQYGYSGALFPDDVALPAGTTTVVDAGGPGWRNFEDYREKILRRAKTRVLTFINIVGLGMGGNESDVEDMDPQATARKILEYPDLIVGVKNAHFGGHGFISVERAVEAGRLSNRPVILDNNILSWTGRDTRTKLLEKMRPGDLHTHFYNDRHVEVLDRRTGKIQPFMHEARKRGVLFDLGHGGGSFLWPVADRAMRQGFPPDTISTDIHATSILATQSDMPNCMSKMLTLGMELKEVVYRSTVTPARAISRFTDIGTLGEGKEADVAVLDLEDGVFAYHDAWEMKRLGTRRLANVLTVRAGEIVYDRDARAFADWSGGGSVDIARRPSASAKAAADKESSRSPDVRPDAAQPPGRVATADPIYDLLLKNGHVIDPSSGRSGRFDIAIAGDRIARIAADLPAHRARTTVDVSAYYVTPGLIDLHAYINAQGVFRQGDPRTAWRNVNPEHNTLRHGVTTVVDGGSTGWKNFESFKQLVIDRSRVQVLAFLNIVGSGMLEGEAAADPSDLDVDKAVETARRHPETIVGIRSPHLRGAGAQGVERSIRAAESMGGVALVEYLQNGGLDYRQLVLERLRAGDLITDTFGLTTPLLDANGGLNRSVGDARGRGVLFDLGHGNSFRFRHAAAAVQKGFLPDVISTAMDKTSLLLPRADMMTTLSKLLNLGVSIEQLLERVTVRPARAIKRPELATLHEGGLADIAVIEMQTGRFGFLDAGQDRLRGDRRLRAVLTIRKGEVVWDSEGLSHTDWSKAGPYTNFR
jgi:dihydroorotase